MAELNGTVLWRGEKKRRAEHIVVGVECWIIEIDGIVGSEGRREEGRVESILGLRLNLG